MRDRECKTCGNKSTLRRTAALQRRLDDAESAMRRTLELCQHWWAGGEMDPIKSYFATYQSVVDDDPDSSVPTKATD